MTVAIDVRGLTKRYGRVQAVDDCSFEVGYGSVTGFLGPNGAGKSTTLRMIVGLVRPTSGHALVGGHAFIELTDPGRTVGAVFEMAGFYSGCDARAHVGIAAKAMGIPHRRVDEVLEAVGLGEVADRKVRKMSQGMRQRLQLAVAMLADPPILILDEPTNGLDPASIGWFRSFMKAQAAEGKAVLVSSHVLAEMAQTIDQVVVISDGRIRANCGLDQLVGGSRPAVRIRSSDPEQLAGVLARAGAEVTRDATDRDLLTAVGITSEVAGRLAAEHRIAVFEMAAVSASLEEAFFALVGGRGAAVQGGIAQ